MDKELDSWARQKREIAWVDPVAGMIPAVLHCLLGCCADICCHSADIHHHPLLLDALRFRDPVHWQEEL